MEFKPKRCPENGIELKVIQYEGVELEQCTLCGGIWCDQKEVEEIVNKRIQKFDKETRDSVIELNFPSLELVTKNVKLTGRKCIVCGEVMQRQDYSSKIKITIERCTKGHGIWLDENELERIQIISEN